jgi:3-phytase
MRVLAGAAAIVAVGVSVACARSSSRAQLPSLVEPLVFLGQYVVPAPASPPAPQLRFGGLSGLTTSRDGRELLAVADDHRYPRVFRLLVTNRAKTFRVDVAGVIYLGASPAAPPNLDPEAIAVTRDGHLLITSEGSANENEPRLPPSILEYSGDGRFVRQLAVKARYSPNERGPINFGARENAAFESLALAPDFTRFFTATELPLVQDGDADAFARGGRSRLLEYVATGSTYEAGREFAYEIEPVERPAFDVRFAINGIVELLSLGGDELLAMERAFVESADRTQSLNRIRIFRISVGGATDVSSRDSLLGATDVVPVRKTLVLDVNRLPGLAPPLTSLDNFEGMGWGPAVRGGGRSLILVSDDNFSERQVTAFLLLRPGQRN